MISPGIGRAEGSHAEPRARLIRIASNSGSQRVAIA